MGLWVGEKEAQELQDPFEKYPFQGSRRPQVHSHCLQNLSDINKIY